MESQIKLLENKIEELELALEDLQVGTEPEIDDLEFEVFESDGSVIGNSEKDGEALVGSPASISAKATQRRWREIRDLRGYLKYSNFSVSVKVLDLNGNLVKCDWIEVSDCNYRIKQPRLVKEKSKISFTTDKKRGWSKIEFKVQIKYAGFIYEKVSFKL